MEPIREEKFNYKLEHLIWVERVGDVMLLLLEVSRNTDSVAAGWMSFCQRQPCGKRPRFRLGPFCLSYCPDTERGCSGDIIHGLFGMKMTVSPVEAALSVN